MTPADIAERLLEMGQTLRRLHVRGLKPAEYRSCLPDPIRTPDELFGAVRQRIGELEAMYRELRIPVSQERLTREAYDAERPHPTPPTHAEVSRMDEAIEWFKLVTHGRQKIQRIRRMVTWLKAFGYRTGRISRDTGLNRETVRRHWLGACEDIAKALAQASRKAA